MSSMQMKQQERIPPCNKEVQQEQFEDSDKQELPNFYKDIKEQLTRLKPECLAMFQEWVCKVYKLKVKISNLSLSDKDIQISISPADIQSIVNKILLEACETHRKLIDEQMKIAREMQSAQCFYKIDAEEPGRGYFDRFYDQSKVDEGIKEDGHSGYKLRVSQNFYSYCVWVIYNHYCSLFECNQQICKLVGILRQNSENLFFRILNQIESKKALTSDLQSLNNQFILKNQLSTKQLSNCEEVQQKFSLVEDYQIVKISELNILTIVNLIPPTLPKMQHIQFSHNLQQNKKNQQNTNILYWHICSFEAIIDTIIHDSKQNMRKFVGAYLRNFKKAIKILKSRLSTTGDVYATQNQILQQFQQPKKRKKAIKSKIFNEEFIESQIQKNIDKQRQSDDFGIQEEKFRLDQAQLVKNIDKQLMKQKSQKKLQNILNSREKSSKLKQQKKINEELCIETKKFTSSKIVNSYTFKSSSVQTSQKIQSITRLSAMLSENNVQSYKFEFVVKKSSNVGKQSDHQYEAEQIIERRKKKNMIVSEQKTQKNIHGEILQQLKNRNSQIIQKLRKQQQYLNYLKISDKCKKGLSDNSQLNLHQFIQQNNFRNQQQQSQGNDEAYLEKMEQQHLKNQKKKKKKKNKKKKNKEQQKNQKDQQIQNTILTGEKTINISNKISQNQSIKNFRDDIENEVSEKQFQIIKYLWNTKIDLKNRPKCFQIDDQVFAQMKIRQNDCLEKCVFRNEHSPIKTKSKIKKKKAA